MLHIRLWDQHSLASSQSPLSTNVEEAFDLFIDAPDCLHLAMLID